MECKCMKSLSFSRETVSQFVWVSQHYQELWVGIYVHHSRTEITSSTIESKITVLTGNCKKGIEWIRHKIL